MSDFEEVPEDAELVFEGPMLFKSFKSGPATPAPPHLKKCSATSDCPSGHLCTGVYGGKYCMKLETDDGDFFLETPSDDGDNGFTAKKPNGLGLDTSDWAEKAKEAEENFKLYLSGTIKSLETSMAAVNAGAKKAAKNLSSTASKFLAKVECNKECNTTFEDLAKLPADSPVQKCWNKCYDKKLGIE